MLELISESDLSSLLRQSMWVYPLVNTGHIIGLGLLVGSIVPLDLRLLGVWRSVPVPSLATVLVPVATSGLALAIVCGLLLFITRPEDYVTSALFLSKMGLVVAGVLNALRLVLSPDWKMMLAGQVVSSRVKMHSVLSLVFWFAVIVCGRLIGYR